MQKHLAWGSLWAMLVIQVAGTCLTWFACVQISGESQKPKKTGKQHDGSIVRFACFLRFPEIFAMHATKTRSRTYVSSAQTVHTAKHCGNFHRLVSDWLSIRLSLVCGV